jgi:GNAT superfamily N-acetyltransferase
MYDNPRSLLDQITLVHGPQELLGRYFTLADAAGRDWGLRFRLRSDFDALLALNRENRDTWPALSPIFDPAHSNLRIDSAFWLEGIDERGDTVITESARFFDLTNTNAVEEIRSLRLFFADPALHLAAGERIDIDAPAATAVRGRTMHGGSIWVRPDWRRNGLTRLISRICAAYALTRWNTEFTWGFVEPRMHAAGLSQAYGPHDAADGLTVRLAWRSNLRLVLIWMTTAALLSDLARSLDHTTMFSGERYAHQEVVVAAAAPGQS